MRLKTDMIVGSSRKLGRRAGLLLTAAGVGVALGVLSARPLEAAEPFKLVAHADTVATSLTRREVAGIFSGKISKWPDGSRVVPVDQSATSTVRAIFSREVLGKSVDEVLRFWQEVVFSGRGLPPKVRGSDQGVLEFVTGTPGTLAYVSADTPSDKVRVLRLDP